MKRDGKKWGLITVTLVLLLVLVASSCASGPVAEEDKVVRVALFAAATGALANVGVPYLEGEVDSVRYLNEQGELGDVRLKLEWEDGGAALIPRAVTSYRRFLSKNVLIASTQFASQVEILAPRLPKDKMPIFLATCYTDVLAEVPMTVPWVCTSVRSGRDEGAAAAGWALDEWKEARPMKVGILIYDHPTAHDSSTGVKWACERGNAEVVGFEVVPMMGAIDTSVEWLRLAGEEPDIIFSHVCGATMTTTIKDAKRLEILEKGIKVVEYSSYGCLDCALPAVGTDADGHYNTKTYPSSVDKLPGMEVAYETVQRYRGWTLEECRQPNVGGAWYLGWMAIKLKAEAIKQAIENVGYENLDGQAVRDALFSINNFDPGLLGYPLTLSNAKPYFSEGVKIYQVRDAQIWPISNKIYPWPGVLELPWK